MSYILLVRDENGQASWINKVFETPEQCFEFAKLHNISQENYQIVTEQEFQQYLAEQQVQQGQQGGYRQQGGYQQHVHIIEDQREVEQEPGPQRPVMIRNYRPAFITFKTVGRKIERR
jgi:hypothetical protein